MWVPSNLAVDNDNLTGKSREANWKVDIAMGLLND